MKNSKSIYEILNDIDVNIEDYEKEGLNDMEKENLKRTFRKNIRRKFNFKRFAAIAAALILTIGVLGQTNLGRQVYAAAESKITEISYSIGKALGIERDIEPYANVVNQVVEDKGIAVKLTDVIIDKDELIFSGIVETSTYSEIFHFNFEVFINGKKLNNYGATGSSGEIDDNIFSYYYAVDVEGIDTSEDVEVKIQLNDFYFYGEDKENNVKGKWKFEFTANGEELARNTYVKPLDYSFHIDRQIFILEEFRYNPVSQKITGKIDGEFNGSYQIDFRGYDNLGNEVIFYMTSASREDFILKYENLHRDLSNEITSIKLTPYAAKFPEESGRMNTDYKQIGEEFTIYLNE